MRVDPAKCRRAALVGLLPFGDLAFEAVCQNLKRVGLGLQVPKERVGLRGKLLLPAALPAHCERLQGAAKGLHLIEEEERVLFEGRGRLMAAGGEEVEGGHCNLLVELLKDVIVSEETGEIDLVEHHFARELPKAVRCHKHWIIRTSHQG